MTKNRNWFLKSLLGIIVFSAGLCVFGEALTLKKFWAILVFNRYISIGND